MPQTEQLSINVRDILKTKAPKAKVPGFVIKYLEKIAHQSEINEFLSVNGHLDGIDFVRKAVEYLDIELIVHGLEDLPDARYTFTGNHPLGGIDGMSTGLAVHDRFPDRSIKFLSNDLLSNISNLLSLFVPVNKVGNQSQHRSLPERLKEVYGSERQMVIFPAGICSRRVKGEITELNWNKSFIQKTIESERDVVPVYFEGRNSNFFYTLANLRTFLGIKLNIEMLYLADEMFKQRGKKFNVYFGKPIPYTTFDNSKTKQEWANWVRIKTLELAKTSK